MLLSSLEERLVLIARHAQFGAAEMGEVLLGIEAHMHRGEMNVAPGALNRMRGSEGGGAAHGDEDVDGGDAQLARA